MWGASRETMLSSVVVFASLVSLGTFLYGYERLVPLSTRAQEQAKDQIPQPQPPQPKDEPKVEPPIVLQPKPFPGGGFRGFGKKPRMQTLSERLGVRGESPGEDVMVQLGLPEGEGMMLIDVRENSVAANAGLKMGDILIELGGRNVPSEARDFDFQLGDLKADVAMDAVVLRDGKSETIKGIVLPEPAPSSPFGPKFFKGKVRPFEP